MVAALLLAPAALSNAQEMSPEYRRNFETQDGSLDRVARWDKYVPTEQVTGAAQETAIARAEAGDLAIAADALAAARQQAEASHTMALLIYADGKLQVEDYAQGFSSQSYFDSYSSHKGLLAVATLAAIDRGYLALDDRAADYIPAWRNDDRRTITIGDLLWMQSGLAIGEFEVAPYNPVLDMFIGLDIKPFVDSAPLARAPGQVFEFNHMNSQALHDVLVAASGQRYAALLSSLLWQPLGNSDAMVALDHEGGSARSVCCFINRPQNWLRLGIMLANGGTYNGKRILSRRSVALLSLPAPHSTSFGMNMQIADPDAGEGEVNAGYLADDLYYFEGHGGQRLYIVPSLGLVAYRTGRVDYDWDDVRFANTLISGLKPQ